MGASSAAAAAARAVQAAVSFGGGAGPMSPPPAGAGTFTPFDLGQGLSLVHFSAQRKHLLWDLHAQIWWVVKFMGLGFLELWTMKPERGLTPHRICASFSVSCNEKRLRMSREVDECKPLTSGRTPRVPVAAAPGSGASRAPFRPPRSAPAPPPARRPPPPSAPAPCSTPTPMRTPWTERTWVASRNTTGTCERTESGFECDCA